MLELSYALKDGITCFEVLILLGTNLGGGFLDALLTEHATIELHFF